MTTSLDRVAYGLLVASLGLTQFNLLTAQALFGLSGILWIVNVIRAGIRPALPAFFLPLAIYAVLTVLSAVTSENQTRSLTDCKQLVLFLIVPMVMTLARRERAPQVIDVIIALGAAGALVGIVQFAIFGYDSTENRPVGTLSHYMTYSGVLMLVTCAAFARLLFQTRGIIWPAVAVPALLVALGVTLSRNAWVGAVAAISALLAIRNWRLLIAMPIVAALLLMVVPGAMRDRAYSIVDVNDPTNRDRFAMMEIGREIVKDHPLTGVGPDMVERVYPRYRPAYAVNPTNPHLHNVPIHIAAERGLPALAVWLWFIVAAALGLFRRLRHGRYPAVASTGFAAVIAMLFAGLFEYNFGDSEFLMLFLVLMTLPYAAKPENATV